MKDRLLAICWLGYIIGVATTVQADLTEMPTPYTIWNRIIFISIMTMTLGIGYFAGKEQGRTKLK